MMKSMCFCYLSESRKTTVVIQIDTIYSFVKRKSISENITCWQKTTSYFSSVSHRQESKAIIITYMVLDWTDEDYNKKQVVFFSYRPDSFYSSSFLLNGPVWMSLYSWQPHTLVLGWQEWNPMWSSAMVPIHLKVNALCTPSWVFAHYSYQQCLFCPVHIVPKFMPWFVIFFVWCEHF